MQNVDFDTHIAPACCLCRTPISGPVFARLPEESCCQACFLADRKRRGLAAAVDDARIALGVPAQGFRATT